MIHINISKTRSRLLNTAKCATLALLLFMFSCNEKLNIPQEGVKKAAEIDYTISANIVLPLIGAYESLYNRHWIEATIAVRGDDVNSGGLGDQPAFWDLDRYKYNANEFPIYEPWRTLYTSIFRSFTAIDLIEKYRAAGADSKLADQYVAECKTMSAFYLLHLSRNWGAIPILKNSNIAEANQIPISSKDEVMQYISDLMDEVAPSLPDMRPNQRTDVRGGITRYTALALKAMANLELKQYQKVADATSQIIISNKFELFPDYYNLFKIPGKLADECLLEFQYSDFGTGSGTRIGADLAFYGINWTPKVSGPGNGWGFFEPSMKFIKFMLDRGDSVRLETTVLFTPDGISNIKTAWPQYAATLPAFVSNITRDADTIRNSNRLFFGTGKLHIPSVQYIPGRAEWGSNKNIPVIRYAEVLLMHAEALTRGATSSAMTAVAAVNLVRERADMLPLGSVTADQVMDEKFAEFGTEYGIRFADMVRLEKFNELSYDGRTFDASKIFLPYPQNQIDLLPTLTR